MRWWSTLGGSRARLEFVGDRTNGWGSALHPAASTPSVRRTTLLFVAGCLLSLSACGDDAGSPATSSSRASTGGSTGDEPGGESASGGDDRSTGAGSSGSETGDDPGDAGGSGNSGGTSSPDDDSGGDGPEPQDNDLTWSLRDADGTVVPALISPTCGHPDSVAGGCPPGEPSGDFPYNCVQVAVYDGDYWMVSYRLSNGSVTDCYASSNGGTLHDNAACQGGRLTNLPGIERAQLIDGVLMYASPSASAVTEVWERYNGFCEQLTTSGFDPYFPLTAVGDDVRTLLSNPPYSVDLDG